MKFQSIAQGVLVAAALVLVPMNGLAQQAGNAAPAQELEAWIAGLGKPGEHHAVLNKLTGEWEGSIKVWDTAKSEPITIDLTVSRQWVLGERFVQETVTANTGNTKINAMGYIGYDNADARYVLMWIDDQSTAMKRESGRYNPETKTFSTIGSSRDSATGFVVMERSQLDLSDPDRHMMVVFTTDETGIERRAAEGELRRR